MDIYETKTCLKCNIKKGDKIIDSIIQIHNNKIKEFINLNPLPT